VLDTSTTLPNARANVIVEREKPLFRSQVMKVAEYDRAEK